MNCLRQAKAFDESLEAEILSCSGTATCWFGDMTVGETARQTQPEAQVAQAPRVGTWDRHDSSAGDYMTGVLAKVRRPPEFLWPGVHDEHPLPACLDRNVSDCCAGVFRLSCAITAGIRSAHDRDSGIGDDDRRQVLFR